LLFDDPAHKLGRGGCVIRIVPVDQNINVRFKSANMPRTTLPLPCRVSVRTTRLPGRLDCAVVELLM
jgi:hypothetical protein